jgi:hypothetical protein
VILDPIYIVKHFPPFESVSVFLYCQDTHFLNIFIMKYFMCLAALALCLKEIVAFPSRILDINMGEEEMWSINGLAATPEAQAKDK